MIDKYTYYNIYNILYNYAFIYSKSLVIEATYTRIKKITKLILK